MLSPALFLSIEKIKADIKSLESIAGLTTLLKDTKAPAARPKEASLPYKLEAFGMDHPGIVNEVTGVLHRHKINVESLETGVGNAPISGTPVFHMSIKMSVPANIPIVKLKDELSLIENKHNLNITLTPA